MSPQAITDILRSSKALILFWHVLLALGAVYLVVMGLAAFAAREKLKGFLRGIAGSSGSSLRDGAGAHTSIPV
ncbi:MAG: hypothetical protein AAGA69_11040 [Pseudomonadota bacterium]